MTSTSDPEEGSGPASLHEGHGLAPAASLWYRAPELPVAEVVYRNPWLQIKSRDGYFSLEYGHPQVAILPLVEGAVLLVKVKRPLICDEPWELPAGGSEKGENPVTAARRELHEETGILIPEERFEPLPMISEMPNRCPELLICFQARITAAEFAARGEHEKEITEVRLWEKEELKEAICSGTFYLAAPTAILARFLFQEEQEIKRSSIVGGAAC